MQMIREILPGILAELGSPEKQKRSKLLDQWEAIAGKRVFPHTRPYLGNQGRLYVWVDSSALAFELSQRYRQSLLKRAQAVLGETEIKSIHIRVGQLHS
jgi:predicted nucleic acid-binding Zn ribbon protein